MLHFFHQRIRGLEFLYEDRTGKNQGASTLANPVPVLAPATAYC